MQQQKFIIRRILSAFVVLFGISTIIFFMVHLIPGDPAAVMLGVRATPDRVAALRQNLGLDEPLLRQYVTFLGNVVQGDLGRSFRTDRPVGHEIRVRMWPTIQLALAGMGLALVIGIVAGVLAAAHRDTWIESLVMIVAMIGISVPNFVFGMLLILFFSIQLRWLPTMGYGTWQHLVAPALSLGFLYSAIIARIARSSMVEVLGTDYIRSARAKGLNERMVLYKHALKNELIPVVTIAGLYLGVLLGGTVVIETLFSWPGLGRLVVESILARDYPMIQGLILVIATGFVLVNLLVDLSYGFLDPRIRYED